MAESPLGWNLIRFRNCNICIGEKRGSSRIASGLGSLLKYRHMNGTENPKETTFFNLQPDLSSDGPIIACNEKYWAIPYRGGGGPVYISGLTQFGKVEPDCTVINGHKAAVQDIAFSPFHDGLIATGSADCTVKIWDLESGPISEQKPIAALASHTNSIRTCSFHPTVPGLLTTTSQDTTMRMFDVNAGSEVSCLRVFSNSSEGTLFANISFNYDGTLIAIAAKDRTIRLADPRSGAVVLTSESQVSSMNQRLLGRNNRVEWCSSSSVFDPIASVSANSMGMRQLQIWDPRSLAAPTHTKTVDTGSGQLFPMYDEGLNTIFVVGKGDTIVRMYEINAMSAMQVNLGDGGRISPVPGRSLSPTPGSRSSVGRSVFGGVEAEAGAGASYGPLFFEKACEYQSSREPFAGMCMLPKRACDVRNIEAARMLKLTSDMVLPISYRVPRADHLKAYFQDDIFPLTRSKQSEVSIADWACPDIPSSIFQPVLETLKSLEMMNVSERPAEPAPSASRSKIDHFKDEIAKKEAENKARDESFNRLQQMAVQNAQYNINKSGPVKIGGVIVSHPQAADDDSDGGWDD